jgi:hypothetical protein
LLQPVRELSPTARGGTSALTIAQPGIAPHGTAMSGLRRGSNPSSCQRCSASSGKSSVWNVWPRCPRHRRRLWDERCHSGMGEMKRLAEARRLRTVVCPLGLMRGLNRPPSRSRIPASPSRRASAPVMTGDAPSARAAPVSPRAPIAHARWEPSAPAPAAALGGGRSRRRFPATAPEGTTPARSRRPS